MKKILLFFIFCSVFVGSVQATPKTNDLFNGIQLYKAGDFVNAKNSLQMEIKKDPSNAFAHYYLAMCFTRLNDYSAAKNEYSQVIKLNESSAIASYAIEGLNNLGGNLTLNKDTQIPNKAKSAFTTSKYESINLPEKNISNEDQKIKNTKTLNQVSINKTEKEEPPPETDSLNNEKKVTASTSPTPEEIKKAYETISKSNLSNNMSLTPEMIQLQMMMGSMGNNNMMNSMLGGLGGGNNSNPMSMMMPMIMSQMSNKTGSNSTDSGVNAQLIQSMMTNMMMPNIFGGSDNNNNNEGGYNY